MTIGNKYTFSTLYSCNNLVFCSGVTELTMSCGNNGVVNEVDIAIM